MKINGIPFEEHKIHGEIVSFSHNVNAFLTFFPSKTIIFKKNNRRESKNDSIKSKKQ